MIFFHLDRDYREERHRRGSHRSPSPRQRCSSRERSRYYDYDRRHTSSSATSGNMILLRSRYYDYDLRHSSSSATSGKMILQRSRYYDYDRKHTSSSATSGKMILQRSRR